MITLRPARRRGHADHGWLDTWHTFSFADYHDPAHMGFSVLRVLNEDRVAPDAGFPAHPHHDMEILTIVLEGALEHHDSMGNGSVIRPGEVQRMSAGTGVLHSEYNPSRTEPVHFLQIWIRPATLGLAPSYEQRAVLDADPRTGFAVVASADGRAHSATLHQDAAVYWTRLAGGGRAAHALAPGRRAWVHAVHGDVLLNGTALGAGDGAGVEGEARLEIHAADGGEALLFDLP